MEKELNTFKIIKEGYVCEYLIQQDEYLYNLFVENLKNQYSTELLSQELYRVTMDWYGKIPTLNELYDEVYIKMIEYLPDVDDIIGSRMGRSVSVTFDATKYPYIYKLLKDGFRIDILDKLNTWLESDNECHDSQIKNKKVLIESYFRLIDFELIKKVNLDGYEKNDENTNIIESSCFKDIINEKLDRAFEIEKGKQKTKR